MSSNILDQETGPEEIAQRLKQLETTVQAMRTVQRSASDALPFSVYPGISTSYDETFTLGANSQHHTVIALRENSVGPMVHEPAVTIHIDTDDTDHRWRDGGSLTSGQSKLFYSVTRNWEYGLVSQDPLNNAVWGVQLWNLDSASHVYSVHFKFYSHAGLSPLVDII